VKNPTNMRTNTHDMPDDRPFPTRPKTVYFRKGSNQ